LAKTWLLGYEFPDTLLAVTEHSFVFMASAKKSTILEGLLKGGSDKVPIEILKRSKDEAHNAALFTQFFSLISKSFGGVC
jgi:nucleosome binding factor SPN SPT16 subunit